MSESLNFHLHSQRQNCQTHPLQMRIIHQGFFFASNLNSGILSCFIVAKSI